MMKKKKKKKKKNKKNKKKKKHTLHKELLTCPSFPEFSSGRLLSLFNIPEPN